tara:strand:+ start:40 stop:912 length:873 start_codon:yes stop_codon:yes gene_type:complete
MKTVTSVSGGQSSAYVAANYPSEFLVFALVCIEDRACTPKDKKLVQMVSDKIGKEFIATAEDDTIIYTMLDLEQYLGRTIDWVSGITFDEVARNKTLGGYLPSSMRRYCTVEMKLRPMYRWYKNHCNIQEGEVLKTQIGFRSGEERRAENMAERCDKNGVLHFKDVIGKHANGNNKWATSVWQMPVYPLIKDGIKKDRIVEFWKDKPVRFAERNNCVGCFHRNPLLLRQQFDKHPEKMEWFAKQERGRKLPNDMWKPQLEMTYDAIKKHRLQMAFDFEDFSECDSGHCGL